MAVNFGLANDYNVFVFGSMSMSSTDAEGRVAVGGSAVLSNYGVGAGITPLPPANTDPTFVIAGDVNVSGGSNASGNTVISPSSTVISYTMGNPNGALLTGTPIDFAEAERYLKCACAFWGALEENGTGEVQYGQLNLTGTDSALNVFRIDAANVFGSGLSLAQLNGINIIAPIDATILINVEGASIQYGSYQIFRNGTGATRENARKILWNYPDALTWSNGTTAIYGSVLAPYAAASTTFSQINGNIIFDTYSGNAESHNELFVGVLPEPTVCLLPTTSTTTTTSTTSTTTTTTAAPHLRSQAVSDLLESVALQQAALAHILNAEGEKLQKVLSLENLSHQTILQTNQSVESMVNSITGLEGILQQKLALFDDCLCQQEE